MQIQTTTITTETITALDANFQITSFEMKTKGFCDVCGTRKSGSTETLEREGWYLGKREQFCPACND
jgi:hypothetical protein